MPPVSVPLFTLDVYHRLIAQGNFAPGERVELIAGQLQTMSPKDTRHTVSCMNLLQLLIPRLPAVWMLRCQDPITLPGESEPEPDVVIVKTGNYLTTHPTPTDIIFILEIADTSLAYDRDVKAPLYAQSGITHFWLVNLVANQLEIYTEPSPLGYQNQVIYHPNQMVLLPDSQVNLPLAPLFPSG